MDAGLVSKYHSAERHMAEAKNAVLTDLLAVAMFHYTEGITSYLEIIKLSVVHPTIHEFVKTNQLEMKARDYTGIAENVKRDLNERISNSWTIATRLIKEAVDHDTGNHPDKAVEGYRKGCELLVLIAKRYLSSPRQDSSPQLQQVITRPESHIHMYVFVYTRNTPCIHFQMCSYPRLCNTQVDTPKCRVHTEFLA